MPEIDELVDKDKLRNYLTNELGSTDKFEVERHSEGMSNETLFLNWGDQELVIRRPPPGDTAETAHDVLREYRAIHALQDTSVPVPNTILSCSDHSVMGCDFYVMERLEGDVIRWSEPERFQSREYRQQIGEELVDTLAHIHSVDYEEVGLGEFGHPEGYTQRQVDRWTKQLEWAFEETEKEREVPTLKEVGSWLEQNVPESHDHTLVHGDYKLDNVMYAPETPPLIVGVLDWEMSTLGDPLFDLGWMLFFWSDEKDPDSQIMDTFASSILKNTDYSSRRELVDRYEDRMDIKFDDHRFYRALAAYKMAGLGEMFYARYLMGHSDSTFYQMMEEGVPSLAKVAMDIIEDERPL